MDKIEILELLFKTYREMPETYDFNNILNKLTIDCNENKSYFDLETELYDLCSKIAFDNFMTGFKVAVQIMSL